MTVVDSSHMFYIFMIINLIILISIVFSSLTHGSIEICF